MNLALDFEVVAYEYGKIAGIGALVHADEGASFTGAPENLAPMFDRG
jgi:hypothetical protein